MKRFHNNKMQQTVHKKDSFQSWVICLVCLFVNVIVGGIGSAFQILKPTLEEYFNENPSLISFIGSLNMGMWFILDFAAAWLFLKFGIRTTYMVGSLIATISVIASTFSPNAQIMVLLYGFFAGTGLACIELMAVIACDTSFEKRRAMASSIARGGIGIGAFILPPTVNFLLSHYGWQQVLYTYSVLFFVPFCAGFLTIIWNYIVKRNDKPTNEEKYVLMDKTNTNKNLKTYHSSSVTHLRDLNLDLVNESLQYSHHNKESPGVSDDIAMLMNSEKSFKPRECSFCNESFDTCDECIQHEFQSFAENKKYNRIQKIKEDNKQDNVVSESLAQRCLEHIKSTILWNPVFLLIMLGKFFGAVSYFTVTILFASLLLEKGFTLTEASNVASVVGIVGIVGSIVFGIITDRTKVDALSMSCLTMILTSLTTISIAFTDQYELLWLFSICNGFVRNTFMSLGSVLMFDILPYEQYPLGLAYSGVFQGIGTIAGPPFAGYFYTTTKSYTTSFCIASVSALLCGTLFTIANILNRRKTKEMNT